MCIAQLITPAFLWLKFMNLSNHIEHYKLTKFENKKEKS